MVFLSASRSANTPPLLICGIFGLSQFACVSACDMKEQGKYEGEKNLVGRGKAWEEPEIDRESGSVVVLLVEGGVQTGELDNNGWGPMTANSI